MKPYDLFQVIRNESDEKIIRLIKNNTEVAALAFSFGKPHQKFWFIVSRNSYNFSEMVTRFLRFGERDTL